MYEITYVIPSKYEEEYSNKLISAGINSFCFEKISGVLFLKIYSDKSAPVSQINNDYLRDIIELHESDWKNKWAEDYTGHKLTDNIFVHPPGVAPPQEKYKYKIIIDPEDSFGDGHHPTTRLCGDLLESVIKMNENLQKLSFLDIGTGSGVLAIAAALMDIRDIELFDYDKDSVLKAERNLLLNGITGARPSLADIYKYRSKKKYDIITANLLSKIIEDNICRLRDLLKPDGYLILSGISSKWGADMEKTFKKSGFKIILHKKLEQWEGFVLKLDS